MSHRARSRWLDRAFGVTLAVFVITLILPFVAPRPALAQDHWCMRRGIIFCGVIEWDTDDGWPTPLMYFRGDGPVMD